MADETTTKARTRRGPNKPKLDHAKMWETLQQRLRGSLAFMEECLAREKTPRAASALAFMEECLVDADVTLLARRSAIKAVLAQMDELLDGAAKK